VAAAGRGFIAAERRAATAELEEALRRVLAPVVPLALVLIGTGAWLLSSLVMRPLNRLREAMTSMTPDALGQRLSSHGEDREFRELIGAYNAMLERLAASFEQASRFSADAAHELKTPLTVLQGRLELALRRSESGAMQEDLAEMLEEVGRLAAITRKLLLLSQADAGGLALNVTKVDLAEMLAELVADGHMLATGHEIASAIEPGLSVQGDALLLGQLFNNLVSNALRYCPPGGRIEVAGRRAGDAVEVVFSNTTAPIAARERQRLFDRFYRLDPARTRKGEGSGLGLSLAREIARAHGGDLQLEPSAEDVVRLRVTLPVRPPAGGRPMTKI
jgi:heavy metal sensor kinase